MKKIMFNDKYGLTKAVIDGRKTMTRRIISESDITGSLIMHRSILDYSRYKVGEIVAIAQSYRSIYGDDAIMIHEISSAGMDNKMFVKAELMINKIKFTGIRFEKLQEISDEDCLKEGIIKREDCINSKMEDIVRYTFENSFENGIYKTFGSPREAFAALIDKVSGKGTWEQNPYVHAYSFELVK